MEKSLKEKQIAKAIAGEYKNTPISKLPTHIALNMVKNNGKYVPAKKPNARVNKVYGGMTKKRTMYKGGGMSKAKPC